MSTGQIILDVVLVLITVLMVVIGIKRGFVKSFFKSTKMLIVIIITALLSSALVGVCQDLFVRDMFEGKISTAIVEKVQEGGEELDFNTLAESLPDIVKGVIPMSDLEEHFNSMEGSSLEVAQEIGTKIEEFVIVSVSEIAAYIITFIAAFIVCSIVIFFVEKFCELPVLNKVNKVLGLVWGLSGAYIVISVVVFLVSIFAGMDFVEGTIISRLIYKIGLFTA